MAKPQADTCEAKTTNETATNKTIGKNAANEWLYEPYTHHGGCMVLCDRLNRNPRSQTQPPNSNPPNKDLKQGVNHEPGMPQMNHTPAAAAGVWFYLRSSPELPPMKRTAAN
ncbi:hypothetical protein BS47DRAFT_1359216 [Hydnum rufescens UP504]|uniref:Uncharacterized protein n=1 Tax=Hydnum rufescens UP504 TaxID=1448309 RepID=A0A9P6E0D7_9AGAM|nr:hypothetical protein BS47DRAFT_1359216 [Hydnum rufescens UP504]